MFGLSIPIPNAFVAIIILEWSDKNKFWYLIFWKGGRPAWYLQTEYFLKER